MVAVLVAGAILFAVAPQPASADAEAEEFTIEGDEITLTEDGDVDEVWLFVQGGIEWWDFEEIQEGEIELTLEDPDGDEQDLLEEPITFEYDDGPTGEDNSPQAGYYEWDEELPILERTDWTGGDIAPEPGETESTEMTAHLDVELVDEDGETVTVEETATFTITVERVEDPDPQMNVTFGGQTDIEGDEVELDEEEAEE